MSLKGKIDRSGILYINRAGRLIEQICPYGPLKIAATIVHYSENHFCAEKMEDRRWFYVVN